MIRCSRRLTFAWVDVCTTAIAFRRPFELVREDFLCVFIFHRICEYLSSLDLRYEVNEGLNVVERWNAANDFFCYGRQGILATNSRAQQEISTLCLQLLQNCLMLINTLLVQRTIAQHQLLDQFSEADRRALTPLRIPRESWLLATLCDAVEDGHNPSI